MRDLWVVVASPKRGPELFWNGVQWIEDIGAAIMYSQADANAVANHIRTHGANIGLTSEVYASRAENFRKRNPSRRGPKNAVAPFTEDDATILKLSPLKTYRRADRESFRSIRQTMRDKKARKRNPRGGFARREPPRFFMLFATKGRSRLKYDGVNFSARHSGKLFPNKGSAEATGRNLLERYGRGPLRGFTLTVEPTR